MIEPQPTFRLGWKKKTRRRKRRKREEAKRLPLASIPPAVARAVQKYLPAAVVGATILAYIGTGFLLLPWLFSEDLPWWGQRLLGLVYAAFAVLICALLTRARESPDEELLERIRRGQHADFGKRLRKAQEKRTAVKLPVLGETSIRKLSAAGVFLVAVGWWFTPWAPVGIRPKVIGDLNAPLAEQIMAAVLVMADGQTAALEPPTPSAQAREVAAQIDRDDNAYLRALKAIAESRFEDAQGLLSLAMSTDAAEPQQVNVARAQNSMYAGEFSVAVQWYEDALRDQPDSPMLLCQAAVAWMQAGAYATAKPLLERAARICREKGSDYETTLALCSHLQAILWVSLDHDYRHAERTCVQARSSFVRRFGEQHPLVASSRNNQAVVYLLQARYPGADGLFQEARSIWARSFGKGDLHVAAALGNLAMVRYRQGRYCKIDEDGQMPNRNGAGARELLDEALAIQRVAVQVARIPHGHPLLAVRSNAAASVSRALGQYEKAQRLAEGAKGLIERAPGETQHPDLAVILNTLATVYTDQAYYAKAEQQYLRALEISEEAWGPQHPYLAGILNNLARLYLRRGRFEDAEMCSQRALEIAKGAFGDSHPSVADALNTLGKLQIAQERFPQARPYLEEALMIRQQALGAEHPDVARTLANLGALDNSPLTYTKGAEKYERGIEMAAKSLGPEHPEIARMAYELAALYLRQRRYAEAESCVQRALAIREKALVTFHPDLAATLELYASLLRASKPSNAERADAMMDRAKSIRERHNELDQPG